MKRKGICCLLAAVLMLVLAGCASQDYEKAMELFGNEQYSEARAIFAELADYEDSAAMVRECSYRIALELLDDKDYKAALSLFTELEDYCDSPEMVKKCCYYLADAAMQAKEYSQAKAYLVQAGDYQDAWEKLASFPQTVVMTVLEEQGELVYNADSPVYRVTLYPVADRQIGIRYTFNTMVEDIEQGQEVTLVITWGQVEAQMTGTSTGNILIEENKTYDFRESAEGVLMLDTYRYGEKINWSEHISWCANGNYTGTVPIFVIGALARDSQMIAERMIRGTQEILREQNMEVTLTDLGFASIECN